jgi:hypothetical protein
LYVEISNPNRKVSVYGFNEQRLFCEGDFITLAGEAYVHVTTPKKQAFNQDKTMIVLKKINKDKARQMILDYITEHHEAKTSEIILELILDVDLVLNILEELKEEDEIFPVDSK